VRRVSSHDKSEREWLRTRRQIGHPAPLGAFPDPGVVMAVLGLLAAAVPLIATPVMETFAGWLFLTGGFIGLAALLTTRDVPGLCGR
jgi:uncharacterized membrane protein HdeD (DUF308 family)